MEKQSTRKFLKLIVALVAFFLLGASALLFASCNNEHEHAWADEPVESVPPTCTSNGSNTFTCTVEGCTETNVVVVPALGHDYQLDSAQSSDPTCTQNGQDVYRCSRCDDTYSVTKPATGHKWGEWVTKNATCEENGSMTRTCQNEGCGEQEVQVIPATGHSWDNGTVEVAATCAKEGTRVYKCTHDGCDAERRESIPVSTVHSGDQVKSDTLSVTPTCAADGTNVYVCSVCNDVLATVTVPATGKHDMQKVNEIAASCEENGREIWQCQNCTYSYEKEIEGTLLGHDYVVNTKLSNYIAATCVTDGRGTFECTRCEDRYAGTLKKLSEDGQHTWIPNTDSEDDLSGAGDELGDYDNIDAAKADGWTTITARDCETAGRYQRVCSVCKEVETKNFAATGHAPKGFNDWFAGLKATDTDYEEIMDMTHDMQVNYYLNLEKVKGDNDFAGICVANPILIDAEGNDDYAYVCENENCPVEVQVDEFETAHYIKIKDHDWSVSNELSKAPTCTATGVRVEICELCGDAKETELPKVDHSYNTFQLDGRTDVVVCEADALLDEWTDETDEAVQAYIKAHTNSTQEYIDRYNEFKDKYNAFVDENPNVRIAMYCEDCFQFVAAKEHSYIYPKLDGRTMEDYTKDPDTGLPVEAEGITAENFTCEYVLVCEHCGIPKEIGPHSTITVATCREGGFCIRCGVPQTAQGTHRYVNVDNFLAQNADLTTVVSAWNGTEYTYAQLKAAYEAVSATNDGAWMVPVKGSCDVPGKETAVCISCLMDAASGKDFDWTTDKYAYDNTTKDETAFDKAIASTTNRQYSGLTYTYAGIHNYQIAFFTTNARTPSDGYTSEGQYWGRINWEETDCMLGYKTAYICTECKDCYVSDSDDDDQAGAAVKGKVYTDATGWVKTSQNGSVDMHTSDNHVVYLAEGYSTTNGYLASTCVNLATVPYHCQNCAQIIVDIYKTQADNNNVYENEAGVTYTKATLTENEDAATGHTVTLANNLTVNAVELAATDKDANLDPDNHANTAFECLDHCNAYVEDAQGVKHYCSGFDTQDGEGHPNTVVVGANTGDIPADALDADYHETVRVTYVLSDRTDDIYLEDYNLMLAVVDSEDKIGGTGDNKNAIDWKKVDLITTDSASKCAGELAGEKYVLPIAWNATNGSAVPSEGTVVKYIVLVDKETGDIYYDLGETIRIFSADNPEFIDSDPSLVNGNSTQQIALPSTDQFFIDFGYDGTIGSNETAHRPEKLPVKASDGASLALAAKAPYSVTDTNGNVTKTIKLSPESDIAFSKTSYEGLEEFLAAINGYDEPTGNNATQTVVLDLNGGSLSFDGAGFTLSGSNSALYDTVDTLKIVNGTLNFTGLDENVYAISLNETSKAIVLENVVLNSSENGIKLANGSATLSMTNSTINAYGTYGIIIDNPACTTPVTADSFDTINLNNSDVYMLTVIPETVKPEYELSTALYVGASVNVVVTNGSVLSAAGQAVVVRAGDVSIANSDLIVVAGYEDAAVTSESFSSNFNSILDVTTTSFDADAEKLIKEWAPGVTLQDYRNHGLWGAGNAVSRAVLVVGNSSEANDYQAPAAIDLVNVDLVAEDGADVPELIVASHYAQKTMEVAGVEGAPATIKTMVTIEWDVANAARRVNEALTLNSIEGSVSVNP